MSRAPCRRVDRSFRRGWARAAALVSTALVGACGGDADADDTIKVGAIFDLTGPTADVGTDYAAGIQAWVAWVNEQGGIAGRPVELLYQDYGYQVDRAERLYSQFVNEGAVVFMGWGTGDTEALRLRVAEDEIPFSSASLSHPLGNPDEAPYNFLVATTYTDQFKIALRWIDEDHRAGGGTGAPVVALMHNASPFGLSPYQHEGGAYAEELGIDLTLYEMPRGATDYTAEISRIGQSGARYVVFQNTSAPAAVAMRNAESLGLDVQFICLNWCSNALLVDLAGDVAEGTLGTMPYAPLSVDAEGTRLIRSWLESRGEPVEGKTNAFTQGWWTISVFGEAMARVLDGGQELTGADIRAALESFEDLDMAGVTSPLTFSTTNHRGSTGLRIFRVEEGAWVPFTDFLEAPGTS